MSYAKVLGATNRKDGYLEGNGYLVSWCVGHLVELAPPNVYDAKYVKWSIADLPILPQKWQYLVSASTKKQFGILQKLMNRPDVDSVICATDAGREGELIFRLVYQQAGCKKPFSRLWLSSMEENAIREGFAHLKPSTEYDALYNAALCRERADWMVGINASRLFSCLYGQPLAVGRVMTPVLAMTVVREAAIAAFVPEKFYTVALTLADGGTICAGEEFSAKGKVVLSEGWKTMERKMLGELLGKQKESAVLPDVQEQSQCSVTSAELKEGQTSPPKSYTEDTLLSAMQAAGADSMPEGVERQGIGTPATRAATIEKLVQKGFLERKGNKKTKVLLPTDKGKALITVMPEEIQSPEMTADWEAKLLQIERSEMEPETFMNEIKEMISSLVKTTEAAKGANALMKNKIIGICPNCGKPVVEREKGWFCENRECRFVLWKDNAFFKRLGKRLDGRMADKLLRDGRVRLKDCKSAKGKTYNATVLLGTEADGRSKFSLEFEGGC